MKGSEFVFDYGYLMDFKCHKTCSMSCHHGDGIYIYIYSLNWIKTITTIINSIEKNDKKCFQYVVIDFHKE